MKRRFFIVGSSTLAVSGLLSGCGSQQKAVLKVRLLKNSIPIQLLNEFSQEIQRSASLDLVAESQLQSLFTQLQNWQQKAEASNWWSNLPLPFGKQKTIPLADLVTLGDYWLEQAIAEKLIQPLDPKQLSQWQQVPQAWQELVRRNDRGKPDPKGKIWGAPYRWGSTVIVYRRDKFASKGWKAPTDWADLWRKELGGRISLLDQPREVIGLTLKKLGHSYNTEQLEKIPNLKQELLTLHKQVKFYSSNTYLQPLILGDTDLAIGWSSDVLPVIQRYRNIAAVVPQSGTALWTDLWVRPLGNSSNLDLAQKWIDFCWQPEIARLLSRFTPAASPILAGKNPPEFSNPDRNQLVLSTPEIIKKSEFLLPLSEKVRQEYQSLWTEVRFQGLGVRDKGVGAA
ncbi:extracellular solute-binding protein [Aerosakkonema sp. BLCC-F183]|uniref:extracellular solute-binding protein n=1 Tax=Aerosakkonema sp. BLCC-F183 TaxID=3342834 RepID=UPI0035BA4719